MKAPSFPETVLRVAPVLGFLITTVASGTAAPSGYRTVPQGGWPAAGSTPSTHNSWRFNQMRPESWRPTSSSNKSSRQISAEDATTGSSGRPCRRYGQYGMPDSAPLREMLARLNRIAAARLLLYDSLWRRPSRPGSRRTAAARGTGRSSPTALVTRLRTPAKWRLRSRSRIRLSLDRKSGGYRLLALLR